MAKRRQRQGDRAGSPGRFVQIPFWVLETPAARHLSGSAFKVLVYLLKRFDGTNNGRLAFGIRSGCFRKVTDSKGKFTIAEFDIGMKTSATMEALRELEVVGFVRCTKESIFNNTNYRAGQRAVREWALTWIADPDGPPTKEFAEAPGTFDRQAFRRGKNRSSALLGVLSPPLQHSEADRSEQADPANTPYSTPQSAMTTSPSTPGSAHIVTIHTSEKGHGSVQRRKVRALQQQGGGAAAAVEK